MTGKTIVSCRTYNQLAEASLVHDSKSPVIWQQNMTTKSPGWPFFLVTGPGPGRSTGLELGWAVLSVVQTDSNEDHSCAVLKVVLELPYT